MFQLTHEEAIGSRLQIATLNGKETTSRSHIVTLDEEPAESRSQFATLKTKRGQNIKYLPYAFTRNGIAMLSSVLRSQTAVDVNISIMQAFTVAQRESTRLFPLHRLVCPTSLMSELRLSYRSLFERPQQALVFIQQNGDDHEGIVEECVRTIRDLTKLFVL